MGGNGWSVEGMKKFNEIAKQVKMDRIHNGEDFNMQYKAFVEEERNKKHTKKQKRIEFIGSFWIDPALRYQAIVIQKFFLRLAFKLLYQARIDVLKLASQLSPEDSHRRILNDVPILCLTYAQCILHLLALGDIATDCSYTDNLMRSVVSWGNNSLFPLYRVVHC